MAGKKTSGLNVLKTCNGATVAPNSDVRQCFKMLLAVTNMADKTAPCDMALYGATPAGSERDHSRTLELIRKHYRKAYTGNSAIYDAKTVRRLVASPDVRRIHSSFKYSFNAIEEIFWAVAVDVVTSAADAASTPTSSNDACAAHTPKEHKHILDDAASWRRAALFQT